MDSVVVIDLAVEKRLLIVDSVNRIIEMMVMMLIVVLEIIHMMMLIVMIRVNKIVCHSVPMMRVRFVLVRMLYMLIFNVNTVSHI